MCLHKGFSSVLLFFLTAACCLCIFSFPAFAAGDTGSGAGSFADGNAAAQTDDTADQAPLETAAADSEALSAFSLETAADAPRDHFAADAGQSETVLPGSDVPASSFSEPADDESQQAEAETAISLGSFRLTAYCPCTSCSGRWGRQTSSGALASAGRTVAVDPRVIPIGSRLQIGGTVYTAEDVGGGVRGNHVDIFFDTHEQTRLFGSRHQEIYLLT